MTESETEVGRGDEKSPGLPAHMLTPEVQAAQAAWEQHFAGCPDCQAASSHRTACADAQRLHEDWVILSHQAYREARS